MPKPLDQVLKEAVEHREENFKNQFPDLNKDYQIELLNREHQNLVDEIDSLNDAIKIIREKQKSGELEVGWGTDITIALAEYAAVKTAAVTIGISVGLPVLIGGSVAYFLANHWTSADDFIEDCQLQARKKSIIRGKVKLALQVLTGIDGGGVGKGKTLEERLPAKAKQTAKDQERKAFDEKLKEKRKKKIKIGDDVSGFIGKNENVQPSKGDTFTPYTMPSVGGIQTPSPEADLKKVEEATKQKTEAEAQPKAKTQEAPKQAQTAAPKKETETSPKPQTQQTKPESKYIKQIEYIAGLSDKEIKDLVMKHYVNLDLTNQDVIGEINSEIRKARGIKYYAEEYLKPDGDYSTPKDRKELDEYLFESEYNAPFIKKIFGVDSSTSTPPQAGNVEAKQEETKTKSDETVSMSSPTGMPSSQTAPTSAAIQQNTPSPSQTTTQQSNVSGMGAAGEEDLLSQTTAAPKSITEQTKTPEPTTAAPKDAAEPVKQTEATPKKESSYDASKISAYIESVAKESNKDLRERVKEESKDKSERQQDIAEKKAEFKRRIAQEYISTEDPIKKSQLEGQFIGQVPGVSAKDHAQHLLDLQEGKVTETTPMEPAVKPIPAVSPTTPETTVSAIPEPKAPEPQKELATTELSASTKKSGVELDAVRESMVEDKMAAQQSQPIVVPVPMPMGRGGMMPGGGGGSPTDSMIPMVIINDEEIIRMNSFDAHKLRMI